MAGFSKETLRIIGLINEVIEDPEESPPFSVRYIYYNLSTRKIIKHNKQSYKRLSDICAKGRRCGLIPQWPFSDSARPFKKDSNWHDLTEYIEEVRKSYLKDLWEDQDNYIEIWIEKDTMVATIEPIAQELRVGLQVGRGFAGEKCLWEAKKRFKEARAKGKTCHVLYLGDLDPSGVKIPENIEEVLFRWHEVNYVNFDRIAITLEQVKKYGLLPAIPKKSDSRTKEYVEKYGNIAVEFTALKGRLAQELIRKKVEALTDMDKMNKKLAIEVEEHEELDKLIDDLENKRTGIV